MTSQNFRQVINALDGAIIVSDHSPPHEEIRAFYFSVTFHLDHPRLKRLASSKPPLHFHPYQEEYIRVTSGALGVEVEGTEYIITPAEGELTIKPWSNHRLYPLIPSPDSDAADTQVTKFLLSGEGRPDAFILDTIFFQNWYGYQDEVMFSGKKMDLVQVMNMFDAGGSYLSLPKWLPFGRRLAQWTGILVGRCIGGLLGYQPFHRKWTRDWQAACKKMETSIFLKRFADRNGID